MLPLITSALMAQLRASRAHGADRHPCSLDLGCSIVTVELHADRWVWNDREFPYAEHCKERTIYYWANDSFEPIARFTTSLIKLVPTEWGPPTFEIDGIKMLPTLRLSPYVDAQRKVSLIKPARKTILDTCGGLGYFAAWCLSDGAASIVSYEKNSDVLWLRSLNPWSPKASEKLTLTLGDVITQIAAHPAASFDAILHDPPRFGIAGELYSQSFYEQLARVLKRRGQLFHYTGTPNKLSRGRDLANEVMVRLQRSGFTARIVGDGVLATL